MVTPAVRIICNARYDDTLSNPAFRVMVDSLAAKFFWWGLCTGAVCGAIVVILIWTGR